MDDKRKYLDTDDAREGKQMVLNTDAEGSVSEVELDLEEEETSDEKEVEREGNG